MQAGPIHASSQSVQAHNSSSQQTTVQEPALAPIHSHDLPPFVAWFSPTSIHLIEILSFPELDRSHHKWDPVFQSRYITIRNFMVAAYRMNPTIYFALSTCRTHLPFDFALIQRIYEFLEQYGLINSLELCGPPSLENAIFGVHSSKTCDDSLFSSILIKNSSIIHEYVLDSPELSPDFAAKLERITKSIENFRPDEKK
ncbi:putative SWIRM domain containing protein [Blattamonas nauphoetae]|uniref:SWIRM domain containing protein n=1 Tax=Blattamonas nauphoetae TaxID=2049346 RepID=A0ABQ9XMW8_9EUKA|nr:putative SWIRM domain containing protein [Blattamonas nauphoetae]